MPAVCGNCRRTVAESAATCPYCGVTFGSTWAKDMIDMMNNTHNAMAELDSRSTAENAETISLIKNDPRWQRKSSGRCTLLCILIGGVIVIMIPAFLAYGEIDYSDGTYTRTKKIGEGLIWISILMTALMLLWWFRVFQRGGVPTIKQDMSCSWGYEYMELPQEGRTALCLPLFFSKYKRLNHPSGLEYMRASCMAIVLLIIGIMAIYLTFTSDSCPSCNDFATTTTGF